MHPDHYVLRVLAVDPPRDEYMAAPADNLSFCQERSPHPIDSHIDWPARIRGLIRTEPYRHTRHAQIAGILYRPAKARRFSEWREQAPLSGACPKSSLGEVWRLPSLVDLPQPRVKTVSEPVAKEVQRDHHEENR